MFTEDLSIFFADFGVPCTFGAYAFTGILDTPDEALSMGGVNVLSTMYQLRCPRADVIASGMASDSIISVSGQAYKVRDIMRSDDGAISSMSLTKQAIP